MNLNISYDSNTLSSAPAAFFSAVNYVVNVLDTSFTNNVTVNIKVGYGTFPYDNSTVQPLAENVQAGVAWGNYSQARQVLISQGAVGSSTLPSSSPFSGNLVLDSAQEKALGLIGANSALDGWVGVASDATLSRQFGASWSYSPTAAPASNQYYLVGVLEHEITEVLGRASYLNVRGEYGVMDLYRYAASGVRQTGTGDPAYFSTDGGRTNLDSWNTQGGGDIGDWASSAGADAFLAFSPSGQINGLTGVDLTLMSALGWTLSGQSTTPPASPPPPPPPASPPPPPPAIPNTQVMNNGFDPNYYLLTYPDIARAGVDPYQHYLTFGWKEGRNPDAYFSTTGYLNANPDVKAAGVNPLLHYDQSGWREGRDPSLIFDTQYYLIHGPDVAAAGIDPLVHYLKYGSTEGRLILPAVGSASQITPTDFDPKFYLMSNADVAAAGVDPYQHFLNSGWKEGRNPDGLFDTQYYLAHNPDVAAAGMDPLLHYAQYGWQEGRNPSASFDTNGYLAANPDVAAMHVDPLHQFLVSGLYEGRLP